VRHIKAGGLYKVVIFMIILTMYPLKIGLGAVPTSFPDILSIRDSNNKDEISTISNTGGEVIFIRGSGFASDATVYFTPVLKRCDSSSFTTGSNLLYTSASEAWTRSSGTAGAATWIDSTRIQVKTPAGSLYTGGVIVVNGDGGASEIYEDLTYDIPKPSSPIDIDARIVRDTTSRDIYIKVTWDSVDNATNYDIYRIDDDGKYFYLASTSLTSYVYDNLDYHTEYRFAVKATVDGGISKVSPISNRVTTSYEIGSFESHLWPKKELVCYRAGERATLDLNDITYYPGTIKVDLNSGKLKGCREVVVDIPVNIIDSDNSHQIEIYGTNFQLVFDPSVLNTSSVKRYSKLRAGVRFRIAEVKNNYKLLSGVTLSPVYQIEASLMYESEKIAIEHFDGFMSLNINCSKGQRGWQQMGTPQICYYDLFNNSWAPLNKPGISLGRQCSGVVDRSGYFKVSAVSR